MELQADISADKLADKVGSTIQVLVDSVSAEGAVARSAADAPEIDGLVYVTDGQGLKVGDFATVRVTDSDAHDLRAETA
jgi:ribosomal protein S12 methylthiotransferase